MITETLLKAVDCMVFIENQTSGLRFTYFAMTCHSKLKNQLRPESRGKLSKANFSKTATKNIFFWVTHR